MSNGEQEPKQPEPTKSEPEQATVQRKTESPVSTTKSGSVSGEARPSPYFPLTPTETSSPESLKSSILAARHAQLSYQLANQNLDQLTQLAQSANLARIAAAQSIPSPFTNPFLNPFLPRLTAPIINPLLSIYNPALNSESTSLYLRSRDAINHFQKK